MSVRSARTAASLSLPSSPWRVTAILSLPFNATRSFPIASKQCEGRAGSARTNRAKHFTVRRAEFQALRLNVITSEPLDVHNRRGYPISMIRRRRSTSATRSRRLSIHVPRRSINWLHDNYNEPANWRTARASRSRRSQRDRTSVSLCTRHYWKPHFRATRFQFPCRPLVNGRPKVTGRWTAVTVYLRTVVRSSIDSWRARAYNIVITRPTRTTRTLQRKRN